MAITHRPIRPDEVVKEQSFPEAVYQAFNQLITRHWDGSRATFTQKEAVELIVSHLQYELYNHTRESLRARVYAERLLDVEAKYRAEGWSVTYDRPGYNETYEATFTFKRKK